MLFKWKAKKIDHAIVQGGKKYDLVLKELA